MNKQAVNLTACLFFLISTACSPQNKVGEKQITDLKVEFVKKIVLKSNKSHLKRDVENKNSCEPARRFIDIIYNKGLWAIYYDEADQSVVYYNIDKEEENRLELGEYIRDKQLEEITDMVVYNFGKLLFLTNKGFFTVVDGRVNKFATHKEVNDEIGLDLVYFNDQSIFGAKKRILNDSILFDFLGLCGVVDTIKTYDCKFMALLDFNTLKSKILPVKLIDYFGVDSNRKIIPGFYSMSEIEKIPYIRFKNDTVLMNIYDAGYNENSIYTKGIDCEKDLEITEQLESLDLPDTYKDFWRESLKAKWSQFFKMESEDVYFTVCATTTKISKVIDNKIKPSFKAKIDFYDKELNFINEQIIADSNLWVENLFFIPEKNYLLVQVKSGFDKQEKYLNKQVIFATFDVYKLSVEYEE